MSANDQKQSVQTTGHAWDGDIQEYNNPLPTWWVWTFYASVAFAVIYWILFPSWPFGKGFTTGVLTQEYTVNGEAKEHHWNTRAKLAYDLEFSDGAIKQREYLEKIAATPYEEIAADADMSAFVRSYGNGIFGDNCAACHQTGGNGVVGLFPNLVDDAWLWGGSTARIEQTIINGRYGFMPAFADTFNDQQMSEVVEYALSLSGTEGLDADKVAAGSKLFLGETGGCYYCHTSEGSGMQSQGSANLTDSIWTVANIPGAETVEQKRAMITKVVNGGIQRQMPEFGDRLNSTEIKVLTAYVSGGLGG